MINILNDGQITPYTLILSKRNHDHLGQLANVSGLDIMLYGGSKANEISFDVYKTLDGIDEILWNEINDFKFIYVKELNQYFEIYVTVNDAEQTIKSVSGIGACEAELSQTYLYDVEINTEADIAREDYVNPTIFYKPDRPQESLLHRVLSKVPHYSIKHVDDSLWKIQRTFSANGDDVLSFLTDTIANEIKCLFQFDSTDRSVSVYDLQSICLDCGERGEFNETCTKCGSKNIKYFGEDTTVYIDKENISTSLSYSTDTDSVKNCFRLEAGDDDMTAAIANINPNGSRYIHYFSKDVLREMSPELRERIASYDKLVEQYRKEYEGVIANVYEYIDKIIYLTSGMMPKRENEPTDAKKEAAKLTAEVLSPVGMSRLNQNTSIATINNAMKNYAKIFIHSGKYKVEVETGGFVYKGAASQLVNHGTWTGSFRLTNYGDKEDTAVSPTVQVTINDAYETFLEQKITKKLKDEAKDEGSIFDVLKIKDLKAFKEAIKLYSLNRLLSFKDAFQGVIDILIEDNQAKQSSVFYEELYLPYKEKLDACQLEADFRASQIKEYEVKLEAAETRQNEIHKALDFDDYIGADLYKEYCSFRREDTYSNDNYISDGFENNEVFKRAKEFYDAAYKELKRSGEQQHSIQGDLMAFLACEEFQPLMQHFDLNNFIRVGIDGHIYRLRLIFIEIKFEEEGSANIDVEFSDLMEIPNVVSDTEQILSQASSIASSFGSVANQVEVSKEATDLVDRWVAKGLDLTNMKIVSSATNQNYQQDKNGLLIRSYDDVEEAYSPEQMKLVNSTLAITKDNWETIDVAIGKSFKKDPKTGEVKVFYGVQADQIVGRLILGEELGIYSSDAHMSMEFDNRGLVLNARKGADNQYTKIIDIQVEGVSKLYVDRDGSLVIHNEIIDSIGNDFEGIKIQLGSLVADLNGFKTYVQKTYPTGEMVDTKITQSAESITSTVSKTYATIDSVSGKVDKTEIISSINMTPEEVKIKSNKISLEGLITANNNFKIKEDGSIEAVNGKFTGQIVGSSFYAEKSRHVDITESDKNKIQQIIMGQAQPSGTEGTRFDLNMDGIISPADYVVASNIVNGKTNRDWIDYISINRGLGGLIMEVATMTAPGMFSNSASNRSIIRPGAVETTNIVTQNIFAPKSSSQVTFGLDYRKANVWINGDLQVQGKKNRVVKTDDGYVNMNAVESADAVFEDYGSSMTDNNGVCTVTLDSMFLKTVNTSYNYYVIASPYGENNNLNVYDKTPTQFTVKGSPSCKFDWIVICKQKGYENIRMEKNKTEDLK